MYVLITGAAGSGTSTLAEALARRWGVPALEADDYFWLPTDPPYRRKRDPEVRRALFEHALASHERCVVAGSVVGWGVEASLDLVVFLYVETSVRLRRLRERDEALFGRANPAFLEWAAQYDEGPAEGRSLAKHESWLTSLHCPVIRLVGELTVTDQITRVADAIAGVSPADREGA